MNLQTVVCFLFLLLLGQGGLAQAFDDAYTEPLNGTRLHFRVRGTNKSNPYLLILHGGPGFSPYMLYTWGKTLEPKLNVVYLDQRGCGQSQRLKFANPFAPSPEEVKDYTIANLVKDIEEVRKFLKIEKWYVLGHSWGGMLGLEYVSAHPQRVVGYVHLNGLLSVPMVVESICDSTEARFKPQLTDPDEKKQRNAETLLQAARRIRAIGVDKPQRLRGAYQIALGAGGLYFPKDQPAGFEKMRQEITAAIRPYGIPESAIALANEPGEALVLNDGYNTRDAQPLLPKVTVPTLIINGNQDGVIPPKVAKIVQAGIKSSEILLLENCGHFPFVEQPEKTTEAVLKFAEKTAGRR